MIATLFLMVQFSGTFVQYTFAKRIVSKSAPLDSTWRGKKVWAGVSQTPTSRRLECPLVRKVPRHTSVFMQGTRWYSSALC